jgi:hypothetical protein
LSLSSSYAIWSSISFLLSPITSFHTYPFDPVLAPVPGESLPALILAGLMFMSIFFADF